MPYCAGYYSKTSTFSRTKRLTATQPETGHELAWTWPCHRVERNALFGQRGTKGGSEPLKASSQHTSGLNSS